MFTVTGIVSGDPTSESLACPGCTVGAACEKHGGLHANLIACDIAATAANRVKLTVSVDGMTCAACPASITRALNQLTYVDGLYISLLEKSATMMLPRENVKDVLETIDDTGYDTQIVSIQDTNTSSAELGTREIQLRVSGMFCDECPVRLRHSLERHEWIKTVEGTTLKDCVVSIVYIPRPPERTIRKIVSLVEDLNFEATVYEQPMAGALATQKANAEIRYYLFCIMLTLAAAIPTFLIGICFMDLLPARNSLRAYLEQPIYGRFSRGILVMFVCATPIQFGVACIFHKPAIRSIVGQWKRRSSTSMTTRLVRFGSMNLLISLGVTIVNHVIQSDSRRLMYQAYFSSLALMIISARQKYDGTTEETTYFDSVVFLCFFILIGRFIEVRSKKKMRNAISLLGQMKPREAALMTEAGATISIHSSLLEIGDRCMVPVGASPPVDSFVVDNVTFFDESSLSGESRPVKKSPNDKVFSGTINTGRQVIVEVLSTNGENVLDAISKVISQGSAHRAPIERLGDVLTAYFVPVICGLSLIVFVTWLGLSYAHAIQPDLTPAIFSLRFSVSVFVIACPCGIGLAAPTASAVGSGMCAKLGILASGGSEAFSDASRVVAVVFDKTGTLTSGKMQVVEHEESGTIKNLQVREFLFAAILLLEQSSTHPIAQALVLWCRNSNIGEKVQDYDVFDVQEMPGMGLRGVVKILGGTRHDIIIGNARLMSSYSLNVARDADLTNTTVVFVASKLTDDSEYACLLRIKIHDPIREEAAIVIKTLKKQNIACYLLTGDAPCVAHSVAQQLGIEGDHVTANVSPLEKHAHVLRLNQHYSERGKLCFVGDGINDAAALAAAGVSVSASSASEIAISSASFILVNSDLTSLLTLLKLSKTIYRRIQFNFAWAIVFNIIAIPIAAGIFYPYHGFVLSPAWASLAMALSSTSVVMSSFALLLQRP